VGFCAASNVTALWSACPFEVLATPCISSCPSEMAGLPGSGDWGRGGLWLLPRLFLVHDPGVRGAGMGEQRTGLSPCLPEM